MAEIIERENGPLIVKGLASMTDTDGAPLELKPVRALCRCGHSKNKPFCDGSHNSNGFQSRDGKPAGRDRLIAYEGADVTVFFNPRVCSHAAECGRIAINIFDANKRPWVEPDNGTVDQVTAAITACPSGALTMSETSGVPEHRVAARAEIEVQKDGPYWVTGIAPPHGIAGDRHDGPQIRALPLRPFRQQALLRRFPPRCGVARRRISRKCASLHPNANSDRR